MSEQLLQLVDALSAISLADEVDDPERLAAAVAQRQEILDQLQRSDTSALAPELRFELEMRVHAVLARDEEVLEYLQALQEHTRKALDQLHTGRAAVRGYGANVQSATPSTRRIG